MDDYSKLTDELRTGLRALEGLQERYDAVGWAINAPPFHKYRHICIHLQTLCGRLSGQCERWDHAEAAGDAVNIQEHTQVLKEAAANIIFHMAQIANLADFDLYTAVMEKYAANAKRFAPNTPFASFDLLIDSRNARPRP